MICLLRLPLFCTRMQPVDAAWDLQVNLHEFQSKSYLRATASQYPWVTAGTAKEARRRRRPGRWQVGGQGAGSYRWARKAGGVVLVNTPAKVEKEARRMLASRLVTRQTGADGLPVSYILVEEPTGIAEELYLSALVDRATRRVLIMASRAGGMNIEEIAARRRKTHHHADRSGGRHPAVPGAPSGFALGFNPDQVRQFQKILFGLVKLFHSEDASLVEINPLVVT